MKCAARFVVKHSLSLLWKRGGCGGINAKAVRIIIDLFSLCTEAKTMTIEVDCQVSLDTFPYNGLERQPQDCDESCWQNRSEPYIHIQWETSALRLVIVLTELICCIDV